MICFLLFLMGVCIGALVVVVAVHFNWVDIEKVDE
jgi:hypothetical protein